MFRCGCLELLKIRITTYLLLAGLAVGTVIAVPVTVAVFAFHIPGRDVVDFLASLFR